jgi:hypothetical protein
MHRWIGIILLGAAWAGAAEAREWRTRSEQPFCLNKDDVYEYLLVMNVEGFKGKTVPGCATLKAGLRVTMERDEKSDRPGRTGGVIKIRVVQDRKVLVGYTLADEE